MKEKLKRRHNWKSRQVVEVETDDSATKKIKLDIPDVDSHKYDSSNPLVLPSVKRHTKIKPSNDGSSCVKQLSKKQRKILEKILEKKKKKRNRQEIYEALEKVQVSPKDSHKYLSTKAMQTQGWKRCSSIHFQPSEEKFGQLKSVRGSRKNLNAVEFVEPEIMHSSDNSDDESSDTSSCENLEITNASEIALEIKSSVSASPEVVKNQITVSAAISNPTSDSEIKKIAEGDGIKEVSSKPARYRHVNRTDEIQESRFKLPILAQEQVVMEAVSENSVVIVYGETGSGKTTQVPQFLYEGGYTDDGLMIGVTEPRRVAAITMSQRVAFEMNASTDVVSYQIRYEGNVTDTTEIKFMTDGVLLKEMQSDFLLSKYSAIILDEAHERSTFTDILIGLLSRVVPLRISKKKPLKLIIMSATIRIEDFTNNRYLFKTPPAVVKVDGRQYPVSVHFNRKTSEDYVSEAYRKVCKIHRQSPEGGILVFVTGQREINILCKKLKKSFPIMTGNENLKVNRGKKLRTCHSKFSKPPTLKSENDIQKVTDSIIQDIIIDNYSAYPMPELNDENEKDDDVEFNDFDSDNDDEDDILPNSSEPEPPLYVLPLYSFLSSNKQAKVFEPPPNGCRLCVVATNVAETSITIPNIKYVVDSGKIKVRLYDKTTGVSTFRVMWASKASADQRAGRAGRMGAGHCYRLYSSAVFNDEFIKFPPPEICRRPIDDVVLQLKGMNIDKVINFPFPTAVNMESVESAEKRLILLGALEIPKFRKSENYTKISPLGRAISCFPVAPRYGKMLALSNQHSLLPYVIVITAALSVPELLYEAQFSFKKDVDSSEHVDNKKWIEIRKTWAGQGNSIKLGDVMVLLKGVGACEYVGNTQHYCEKHGINYKSMCEIRKLRFQLTKAINLAVSNANLLIDPKMDPPTDLQAKLLRQIMLSGLPDNIARKVNESEVTGSDECKRKWKKSYRSSNLEDPVFLHLTSVLFREMPDFVVYQEIFESNKMYMKGVTEIEPEWLITFCPNQCQFSPPLMDPEPRFDQNTGTVKCHVTATFGKWRWDLPSAEVVFPEGLERMKWFARFLLNGDVFPKLKQFVNKLLSPPSTMIKSWATLQPRTDILLKSLMVKNVYSKETLSKVWTENNKYLLEEYKSWLPEASRLEVNNLWPPL